jgi:hypothetical protein
MLPHPISHPRSPLPAQNPASTRHPSSSALTLVPMLTPAPPLLPLPLSPPLPSPNRLYRVHHLFQTTPAPTVPPTPNPGCIESIRKDTSDASIYVTYHTSDTMGVYSSSSPGGLTSGAYSSTKTRTGYYTDARTGLTDVYTYKSNTLVFLYGRWRERERVWERERESERYIE